jgi:hypothetical protein
MTWQEITEATFRFVREFGFPSAIVCIFCWAIYKMGVVFHGTVMVPGMTAFTNFLSITQTTLRELGGTQERQALTLQEISHSQERHADALQEITKSQREIVATVKKLYPIATVPGERAK